VDRQFTELERTACLGPEEDLVRRDAHIWGDPLEVLAVDYMSGHHLAEDDAKGEHVDTAVKILSQKDLWRLEMKTALGQ